VVRSHRFGFTHMFGEPVSEITPRPPSRRPCGVKYVSGEGAFGSRPGGPLGVPAVLEIPDPLPWVPPVPPFRERGETPATAGGHGRAGSPNTYGFTFIEVMVVMVILAALAGLLVPALRFARHRADRESCKQEVTRLSLGIENFADQDSFADWPPATLDRLGVTRSNQINEGIESLVLCMSVERGEGPYFEFDRERLTNYDGDSGPENILHEKLKIGSARNDLEEYVDLWETPYVYFPSNAYGSRAKYQAGEERQFEATVVKDAERGTFPAPFKFVIWSCGPDGVNENGEGDDIVSWR
jgi:prepilin-type N-terminal cleavage/methylation domain-containing protein